jgi:hypothetical protein
MHICNSSIWEAEVGGLTIQDQPGLHGETLSQKIKGKEKRKDINSSLSSSIYWPEDMEQMMYPL